MISNVLVKMDILMTIRMRFAKNVLSSVIPVLVIIVAFFVKVIDKDKIVNAEMDIMMMIKLNIVSPVNLYAKHAISLFA